MISLYTSECLWETEAPHLESFHSTHLLIHLFDKSESESQYQNKFADLRVSILSTIIPFIIKQSADIQFSLI